MFNPDFSALVQASERPDISLGSDNFMTYAPPKDPPRVRLQRKIAQSNLQSQEEKRAADSAAMPFILRDMQSKQRAEIEKAEALQSQLDQAQRALQAPIPTREVAQMSQGQMIAAILGSILNPRGTNQTIDQMQGFAQQREDLNFENQMRQYGLRREDAQAILQHLTRQLSGAQDAARDYEKMGYDYQQNAERLAQDQLQWEAEMDFKNRGLTQRQTSAEARIEMDIFKTMWRNAGPEGRAALLAQNGKNPAFIQAFSELTPQEQNIEARTADTKDKTLDRQMTRPLRMKQVQANIDSVLASKGLKEAQKAQILKVTSLLDDRFALDFATAYGRLAVAQQNADTYTANSQYRNVAGESLNDMRLLLDAQIDALTGKIAIETDEKKREGYELQRDAVMAQLLSLGGDGQGGLGGLMEPVDVPPVAPTLPPELRGYIGRPAPGTQKKAPGKPKPKPKTAPRNFSSGKSKAKVTITKID